MRKAILLGTIILLTIILAYGLVSYMGVTGFLFAWTLNFILMMCVFFFTETLAADLSSSYYTEKSWEQNGKFYEKFGVNFFRKLLVLSGWEKFNKKANPVRNDLNALKHLEYRTRQSELGHLIILFIVMGFTIFVAVKFSFGDSIWLLLLNVILNLYPIFLQRYNRPRLNRAIRLAMR